MSKKDELRKIKTEVDKRREAVRIAKDSGRKCDRERRARDMKKVNEAANRADKD